MLAIGIDIGGTKVAGGIVDDEGRVLHRSRRDTPHRSKKPGVVEDTTDLRLIVGRRGRGRELFRRGRNPLSHLSPDSAHASPRGHTKSDPMEPGPE